MSAYTGDIVKDGLTLYLDAANYKSFVSGSTTWYDLARPGFTGSLINGPAYTGSNKGAIIFDGSNDYALIPSSSLVSSSQATFALWNFGNSLAGTTFVLYFENSSGIRTFAVSLPWGTVIYFDAGNGSGDTGQYDRTFKSATEAEFLGWQYWVFTKNSTAGTMRIYRNGELWHSATGKNAPVGASATGSLGRGAGGFYHNGRIGMAKLYSRELSAAEVRENYNATKGRYDTTRSSDAIKPALSTSGLIYNLDAANYRSYVSGSSTWRDLSINRYNGTLTNGPTYSTEVGGAIVFDGTNDYVTSTNAIKIADQNRLVTVEVGFYLDSTSTHGNLVSNRRETNEIGQGICRCGTGSVLFELNSNTNLPYVYRVSGSANAVSRLRVNDWNIVSWGLNIGTTSMNCNFMVNGYTENTSTSLTWFGSNPSTQDDIEICRWANHIYETAYTKSRVSFVRIYNRQLSASEQLSNYDVFKGRLGFVR